MKAEIRKDGHIWIIAETISEAFALNYLTPIGKPCETCGQSKIPVVISTSILNDEETHTYRDVKAAIIFNE